jgi:transposase-like protein
MKRRRWDSKTKTKIVLEGLSGRPVSEICNEYGIHQNQYYTWRDKFLSEAHKAFDSKKEGGEVNRLRKKNQELKQIIGSLTIELKKKQRTSSYEK